MVALRQPLNVVDLLTDQQQYVPIIALDLVHPDVMVAGNDQVNSRFGSCLGNLGVIPSTVGVRSVNVWIGDDFVQDHRPLPGSDRPYCTQTSGPWQADPDRENEVEWWVELLRLLTSTEEKGSTKSAAAASRAFKWDMADKVQDSATLSTPQNARFAYRPLAFYFEIPQHHG